MSDLEQDVYVYPGDRFSKSGYKFGQGQGMTLRDYFAGQALAGYLSAGQKWNDGASAASKAAYYMADAMIKAREGEK